MNTSAKNAQLAAAIEHDARWASVVARDPKADGTFYYSVKTTGVYCRPSCAARLARPENVRFHATSNDAERAGFRPCRRCKPDQPALVEHPRGDRPAGGTGRHGPGHPAHDGAPRAPVRAAARGVGRDRPVDDLRAAVRRPPPR